LIIFTRAIHVFIVNMVQDITRIKKVQFIFARSNLSKLFLDDTKVMFLLFAIVKQRYFSFKYYYYYIKTSLICLSYEKRFEFIF
jgi:hypothetical protein